MPNQTIHLIRRGQPIALQGVAPERTLLEVLREDLACTGTKEGCAEGDCGACTVVLGELGADGLRYRAVNSCIKFAHSVDGLALWTVEDLVGDDGALHPAQEAMVQCHASQCGFCTPGFVMSMFAMYQNHVCRGQPITRTRAQHDLSGNLCRCTGYRPILDAAQRMGDLTRVRLDEAQLARQLQQLADVSGPGVGAGTGAGAADASAGPSRAHGEALAAPAAQAGAALPLAPYMLPRGLAELLRLRAAHPQAQVVAGCTDVGLWVTKQHRQFAAVLDVTRVAELRRIERHADHLAIGAAVTLTDAYAALAQDRVQLQVFGQRFAGLPVRNAGTLGGNVANGSPIGDSMPLLIALGASVVLASTRGQRELPLETLYTGYRTNVMAPDEILAWIRVPLPNSQEFSRVYKISKRFDDDISAVCLALCLHLDGERVAQILIGAGGVAATPVRARRTEALLRHRPWCAETVREAMECLRSEFAPISDMRASAAYRRAVLGNLLQRFWLDSQGTPGINLESFALPAEAA